MATRRVRFGRTQLKKFIKENEGNLLIRLTSNFNGMTDSVETLNEKFRPIEKLEKATDYNLGIRGLYLVCGGEDYFDPIEYEHYVGYRWYNCAGSGELVVKKQS